MKPLENIQNVELVKEKAIAFYDQEHDLSPDDRKQLYVFFEQQCRRMLLGFSVGVSIGAAAPFIVRKKGALVHPAFPVLGAVLGGTIIPGFVNNSIYTMQIEQFRKKFGDSSPICQTIAKTPDPISKAVFWSNYFRKSSENPNFRMKDPRTIQNSTKFFSIEEQPKIPPYGKPGYYKSNEGDSPQTLNEQYLSEWDKVRLQNNKVTNDKIDSNKLPHISIGDSYDNNQGGVEIGSVFDNPEGGIPEQNQNQAQLIQTFQIGKDTDHLIQNQGVANGSSSWDRIRKESNR